MANSIGVFDNLRIKRRVFFSFHYQNDIWRVNQVRQSWRYQHETVREAQGFFDASIWEQSKRTNSESLKALIRDGMKNTTVTCVLNGTETNQRRWVRYEIARSVVKGNGLLVVDIHAMKDRNGIVSSAGQNPLDYLGTYLASNGNVLLAEWKGGKWVRYNDYQQSVTLPQNWRRPTGSAVVQLSNYARHYCYVANDGGKNFGSWVKHAATKSGS